MNLSKNTGFIEKLSNVFHFSINRKTRTGKGLHLVLSIYRKINITIHMRVDKNMKNKNKNIKKKEIYI